MISFKTKKQSQLQIPTGTTIGVPIKFKKNDVVKTVLKVIFGMFIVTFVLSSLIFAYIFFVRRNTTTNKVIVSQPVVDDTISKAEAEKRNLENVLQTPVDVKNLSSDINVTISQNGNASGFVVAKAYEVTNDLKINKQQILESYKNSDSFAPIFYFKLDSLSNAPDVMALSSLITTAVTGTKYQIIYLDTTFTYIKDFNAFVANLRNNLNSKQIKLGLYLYPKWGNEVNYNNFLQVTNSYHANMKLSDVSKLVDEIIIQLYGYSSEYSILPGNVAPVDWAKTVVEFTAQELSDRSNVYFEINSDIYVWPEREFSDNPRDNYAVLDPQAEVLNQSQFDSRNYSQTSSNNLGDTFEVMKTLELSGKKFISVSPSKENIDKLIAIIASYGFRGYITK